ncbi:MAG: UDP-N-acetylmuramoyl-L-alanine--D-glutamate ligase [Candidatus Saccharimonas sp.]
MKVVIAGYNVEGKASLKYWLNLGAEMAIADEKTAIAEAPDGVPLILGAEAFSRLGDFDLIIRTPGVHPKKLADYGDKVWSATREFLKACPAPIIGVTGTKGKGTTASLIASILKASGRRVHLVGNIGLPALQVVGDIKDNDLVVYELSSFQLWDVDQSPHVAVILGIEPDHLDVHDSFDDYVHAKGNIARFQTEADTIVYNHTDKISSQIASLSRAGKRVPYPFFIAEYESSLRIPGKHNIENASAAIAATRGYVSDPEAIRQGLASFEGLPHRLKFVAEKNGVKYYDDSIATTPGSSIAAMHSFSSPKILILGGSDKGAKYDEVVVVARETGTRVLAIGQTGHIIKQLCDEAGVSAEWFDGLMDEVVNHVSQIASPGSVVMLSPASASFDQYANYKDRGEQFIKAVEQL